MHFDRYIGVDYSGAETSKSSLKGLRVYTADQKSAPVEVLPPTSPRKYWTRRGIAEWLVEQLSGEEPTLVGIDHGFSFPLSYFEAHHLPPDWPTFLDDFQRHWPTDAENVYVEISPILLMPLFSPAQVSVVDHNAWPKHHYCGHG